MQASTRAFLLAVLFAQGLSTEAARAEGAATRTSTRAHTVLTRARGSFKLVTYNVAGLPEGVSQAHPSRNMGSIGKLLNKYDLALVQEDFAYATELRRLIAHPHASPPFVRGQRKHFGDGLSQFAKLPFAGVLRETWQTCHGIIDSYFDCLTPKGFTFARVLLGEGISLDIYNLHMDAGGSREDASARAAQFVQLGRAIERFSAGQAVVVAGDTNAGPAEPALLEFQATTELTDTCQRLGCPDPDNIDRVFYRSSTVVKLTPKRWRLDRSFVDGNGRPLSDHFPVAVDFEWRGLSDLTASTR